jgi:hypothetical protein
VVSAPPIGSGEETESSRWWRVLWRDQPGFALSLIYLVLGGAGSYYYTELFSRFSINIFYYAEVGDFLLVIFREPLVPGLTLAAGLILYLIYRIDGVLDSRFPRYQLVSGWFQRFLEHDPYFGKRGRSQMIWEALVVAIVLLFVRIITPFCVRYTVNEIRHSSHRQVFVELNGGGPRALPTNLRLIGTTGRFLFLFDPDTKQTQIIPVESVARLIVGQDLGTTGHEGPETTPSSVENP